MFQHPSVVFHQCTPSNICILPLLHNTLSCFWREFSYKPISDIFRGYRKTSVAWNGLIPMPTKENSEPVQHFKKETVKINFLLRKIFHGNLIEAISLVEIDAILTVTTIQAIEITPLRFPPKILLKKKLNIIMFFFFKVL